MKGLRLCEVNQKREGKKVETFYFVKEKQNLVELEGVIIEALPNAMFRVRLKHGHIALVHITGKMRRNRIRVLLGDQVTVQLSPYDLYRGRIVYRAKT